MDTEEINEQSQAGEHRFFPTAVSEEEPNEARRKSTLKQISNTVCLTPGQKRPQRPDLQGSLIIRSKAAEHYRNGKEAMGTSQFEKAVICFSKAITLKPKQPQLYVSQGEAYLQMCDFQSAAACYKRACLLEPGAHSTRLAFIYFLQGQCLLDHGLYLEATWIKASEVKPGCRAYEVRSLACLIAAGNHSESLMLVNNWMVTDTPNSDLYIFRARLHKRLNQISQCYEDVKSALTLNPACPKARAMLLQLQETAEWARQMAVHRSLTGQLPESLCMINIAIENCTDDGRLYLFRASLYRQLHVFQAAFDDAIRALKMSEEDEVEKEVGGQAAARNEKDERNSMEEDAELELVHIYNDSAVERFSRGLYTEAIRLLNDTISVEKRLAGLYLNRGDCFFLQSEFYLALADYQQADEMTQLDNPAILLRLAVLHNTLGSFSFRDGKFREAAEMFSWAIHYNPTVSQYYKNRSKAFQKLLNFKAARQDFVCMLLLDPTNDEVPALLTHLFPRCSVSDVLFSREGQAMRVHLMNTIQACSSFKQQRPSETLQKMTLADESIPSQSEEPSEAVELKLCLSQQQLQIIDNSPLQIFTEY
uniref:tetratricopeptide repeat protein 16-like isoform X1 n=1 Tax=Scatophagus argus TaxID=75038 RepID=UPI001ED847B8|nr:tetratricopeptide repeat protein 16-like isoform X1 [Scatophagus argus]